MARGPSHKCTGVVSGIHEWAGRVVVEDKKQGRVVEFRCRHCGERTRVGSIVPLRETT